MNRRVALLLMVAGSSSIGGSCALNSNGFGGSTGSGSTSTSSGTQSTTSTGTGSPTATASGTGGATSTSTGTASGTGGSTTGTASGSTGSMTSSSTGTMTCEMCVETFCSALRNSCTIDPGCADCKDCMMTGDAGKCMSCKMEIGSNPDAKSFACCAHTICPSNCGTETNGFGC